MTASTSTFSGLFRSATAWSIRRTATPVFGVLCSLTRPAHKTHSLACSSVSFLGRRLGVRRVSFQPGSAADSRGSIVSCQLGTTGAGCSSSNARASPKRRLSRSRVTSP
jgi:hypothetical protein